MLLWKTTAQAVETLVTVHNNSPIQDYVHPDDQTQPTFESELSYNIRGTFSYITEGATLMSSVTNFDILKKTYFASVKSSSRGEEQGAIRQYLHF